MRKFLSIAALTALLACGLSACGSTSPVTQTTLRSEMDLTIQCVTDGTFTKTAIPLAATISNNHAIGETASAAIGPADLQLGFGDFRPTDVDLEVARHEDKSVWVKITFSRVTSDGDLTSIVVLRNGYCQPFVSRLVHCPDIRQSDWQDVFAKAVAWAKAADYTKKF